MILKFNKHSIHFDENLVIHANKVLFWPIFLHYLFTYLMLWHSPMLAIMEQSSTNYDNTVSYEVHQTHTL